MVVSPASSAAPVPLATYTSGQRPRCSERVVADRRAVADHAPQVPSARAIRQGEIRACRNPSCAQWRNARVRSAAGWFFLAVALSTAGCSQDDPPDRLGDPADVTRGTETMTSATTSSSTLTSSAGTHVVESTGTTTASDAELIEAIAAATELTVRPRTVSPGDELHVEIRCYAVGSKTLTANFSDPDRGTVSRVGPYLEIPSEGDDEMGAREYAGTVIVPYWLEPGTREFTSGCEFNEQLPYVPMEPAAFEVQAPRDVRWDLWRPTKGPWADPLPADAQPEMGGYEVPVLDGDVLSVFAECDAQIPERGARFVVWDWRATDEGFVAQEFIVASENYQRSDSGVVISTNIKVRASDYPDVKLGSGLLIVSALCTATPTPFHPDGEPPLEETSLHLLHDFSIASS